MSEYLDYIEKYVQGELSPTEAEQFEAQLQTNRELQEAYKRYQLAHHALEIEVENRLRNQLSTWDAESKGNSRTVRRLWPRRLAIAASLVLLVSASFWIFNRQGLTTEQFTAQHFERFDQEQTRSGITPKSWGDGFVLIENDQIESAIDFFENVADTSIGNYAVEFILGELYWQKGNIDLATKKMENIIDAGSLFWLEKAQLNYLLLSLDSTWSDKAEQILNNILSDKNHPYYSEARQIKSRLK